MGTKRPTTDEADRHLLADIAGAKVDDGGPAFPTTTFQRVGELEEGVSSGGMTLRDYFAAKVLPNIWTYSARLTGPVAVKVIDAAPSAEAIRAIVESPDFTVFDSAVNAAIVEEAYRVSDAMLKARKGGA